MIRISLIIAFLASFLSLSAQDSYSVFVDRATVNWYQDVVVEYNNNMKDLQSDDKEERFQSFSNLESIIAKISKNCPSICMSMEKFLDVQKNKSLKTQIVDGIEVNALEQRNSQIRRNQNLTEVVMTFEEFKEFEANIKKIKGLNTLLTREDFKLSENSDFDSSDKLMVISEAANANRDFLINNTVLK